MTTSRRARRAWAGLGAVLIAGAGVLCEPGAALAQSESSQPAGRRPVRRPVIDLEEAAKQSRPGQVVEGERARQRDGEEATPEPAPAPRPGAGAAEAQEERPLPLRRAPEGVALPEEEAAAGPVAEVQEEPGAWPAGPVDAVVVAAHGGPAAQWRLLEQDGRPGAWRPLIPGERLVGRIEVRTGLRASATLRLGDTVEAEVGRLTRCRLGDTGSGRSMPTVHLSRGTVRIDPVRLDDMGLSPTPVTVRANGREAIVRTSQLFRYGGFRGLEHGPTR